MTLTIGQAPSPTFRDPLALMSDCHRRVESFLGILCRLAETAGNEPLEPVRRDALAAALRYFREAAPKHTADEEESLFPRLRRLGTPEALAAAGKLRALEADHRDAAGSHDAVELIGRGWLADGTIAAGALAEFGRHARRLRDLYNRHIAVEDHEVFPLAARILPRGELEGVGREMAGRRGQPFERPGFGVSEN
jgi:hemerythrin-like domain-containing protein